MISSQGLLKASLGVSKISAILVFIYGLLFAALYAGAYLVVHNLSWVGIPLLLICCGVISLNDHYLEKRQSKAANITLALTIWLMLASWFTVVGFLLTIGLLILVFAYCGISVLICRHRAKPAT